MANVHPNPDETRDDAMFPTSRGSTVVMVVTDEASTSPSLTHELEGLSFDLRPVASLAEAHARLLDERPDVVLVDGSLVGDHHSELADLFGEATSSMRILLLPAATGAWVSLAHRVDADAILPLPLERAALGRVISSGLRSVKTQSEPVELPDLVDRSDRMRDVWRLVALASRLDASVVVSGETGVGKEAVARALHRFSPRRNGPFVAVNCAALPETLLESELFGHEKGAFTGATNQRKGRFELADGGTLFLDEVGDLPLSLQVKLLRVLQERRFERLGGTRTISVDVRVVCATHRDLEDEVARGRFRADLFYRIRVLSIAVAPLRLRKEDVLPLWDYFLDDGARREGRSAPETSMPARRRLLRYAWPGNVRELQNCAQHVLMLVGSRAVQPADLPEMLHAHAEPEGTGSGSLVGLTLKQIERSAILDTYAALGTIKATAEALGVSERKLHYRLKQYRRDRSTTVRLQMDSLEVRKHGSETEAVELEAPQLLLAEDDDELRWTLHEFLECSGYRVVAVRDGRALLEHLGAKVLLEQGDAAPDVIITDMRMPFLTGLQLLQKVRDRGWETPVVMMSAFGDEELRRQATTLGAAAFLDKPIDTDALLKVLRNVVRH